MAAAGEAAAAPGISLAVGLWALCALIIAIGLKAGWDNTLGAVINGIAGKLHLSFLGHSVNVGGPLKALSDSVEHALGAWILANEQALGLWWHANKLVVEYLADTVSGFGHDVADTFHALVHGTIPATVGAHVRPIAEGQAAIDRRARSAAQAEAHARARGIDATQRDLHAESLARQRGIDNIGAKARDYADAQVGHVQDAIAAERRYAHRVLSPRIGAVEKWLGAGVIGGAAIAALTRVFPWWQCTNVRRFNRLLCRSPVGLPEEMLGFLLAAGAVANLRQLVKVAQAVARETDEGIHLLLRVNG